MPLTAEEEAWFHGETRLAGEQATLYLCNKCGYSGHAAEHPGCGYNAYVIRKAAEATPPVECPQEGQIVFVPGGVAQYRGGTYYSGMEDPRYRLPIQWAVKWWRPLGCDPYPPCPTCAELRRQLDEVDDVLVVNWVGPWKDGGYRKALADLVATNLSQHEYFSKEERDSLRKEVERLVEALRPFAGLADDPLKVIAIELESEVDFAAALLAEHDKEQGGKVNGA